MKKGMNSPAALTGAAEARRQTKLPSPGQHDIYYCQPEGP